MREAKLRSPTFAKSGDNKSNHIVGNYVPPRYGASISHCGVIAASYGDLGLENG